MSLCIDLGYQVLSSQVTVVQDNGSLGLQTFRVSCPAGKRPVAGGYQVSYVIGLATPRLHGSYPDGDDWVFTFEGISSGDRAADLYVVCANT
ncbi:hypothetical protein ACIBI9_04170 [Nonomuraea sp. NPDC050451]|uniref:hypothetical protein n=1 Tax=Nonomuraea sp. NPDC050451 TaxID=3364364 RepID=UPI0037A7C9B3